MWGKIANHYTTVPRWKTRNLQDISLLFQFQDVASLHVNLTDFYKDISVFELVLFSNRKAYTTTWFKQLKKMDTTSESTTKVYA